MYSVCDLRCAQVILQALQNKGFACYHIGSEQVRLGPLSDESSLSTSHCGQVCITRFTFRRRKARGTTRRQSVRSSATARSIGAFSCSGLTALAYRSGHTIDRRIRCILGFVYLPGLLWSGLEASGSMCAASLPEACRHSIIRRRVGGAWAGLRRLAVAARPLVGIDRAIALRWEMMHRVGRRSIRRSRNQSTFRTRIWRCT
jgi:hypothetical protein